jgi:hypothetical protein
MNGHYTVGDATLWGRRPGLTRILSLWVRDLMRRAPALSHEAQPLRLWLLAPGAARKIQTW